MRIVLSSSWRVGKDKDGNAIPGHYKYLEQKLEDHGLAIYDETPVVRYSKDDYSNPEPIILALILLRTYISHNMGGLIKPLVDKALRTLDKEFNVNDLI